MPEAITTFQNSYSLQTDLLYSILLKMGGTSADIEQLYQSNTDDLLYAILKKSGGGGGGTGSRLSVVLHADGSLLVPANSIVTQILIDSDTNLPAFSIGSTNGGAQILPATNIPAGVPLVFSDSLFYKIATTLYFNGIPGGNIGISILTF